MYTDVERRGQGDAQVIDGSERPVKDQDSTYEAAHDSQSASTQGDRRALPTESVAGNSAYAAPSIAAAWDPYEVWLTRVKRPRDLRVGPSRA
jgi:hypothetical protein